MKYPKVFPTMLRSMFYQANWNVDNMQGTGFLWLLKDMFRRNGIGFPSYFSKDKPEYFNTNPYFIMFILGFILRAAKDNVDVSGYKSAYSSAFAALGDTFFWHSLRPFVFFVALGAMLISPDIAIFVYLVLYNSFHLGFRFLGFYFGYRLGRDVILVFRTIKFSRWAKVLDSFSLFMVGVLIAYFANFCGGGKSSDIKALLMLALGFLLATRLTAPIGLMCVSALMGIILVVGL